MTVGAADVTVEAPLIASAFGVANSLRPLNFAAHAEGGELAAAAKNLEKGTFEVWSHYNPLKSHETANGIFGKAWRKRA
jgi:hypothetical protein